MNFSQYLKMDLKMDTIKREMEVQHNENIERQKKTMKLVTDNGF